MIDPVVVVAGEALVDLALQRDGALAALVGGGPFNAARAVARLGQSTVFIGRVSNDRLGRQIAEALAADRVVLDQRLRTERPTSLAMAELDADGAASYRFYVGGTSAEQLEPSLALEVLPQSVAGLYVGGLGLVLKPLADAVEALADRLAGTALVMVDPNVRPAMIVDMPAYAARLQRIVHRADVVKVSEDDLLVLSPGVPAQEAARALLAQGPRLVLLTLGAEGAIAFGAFGARSVTAPKVEVVDTIGAGDTFSGAWLARWLQLERPLDDAEAVSEATTFACRAAALSCTRRGASPPTLAQLS